MTELEKNIEGLRTTVNGLRSLTSAISASARGPDLVAACAEVQRNFDEVDALLDRMKGRGASATAKETIQ